MATTVAIASTAATCQQRALVASEIWGRFTRGFRVHVGDSRPEKQYRRPAGRGRDNGTSIDTASATGGFPRPARSDRRPRFSRPPLDQPAARRNAGPAGKRQDGLTRCEVEDVVAGGTAFLDLDLFSRGGFDPDAVVELVVQAVNFLSRRHPQAPELPGAIGVCRSLLQATAICEEVRLEPLETLGSLECERDAVAVVATEGVHGLLRISREQYDLAAMRRVAMGTRCGVHGVTRGIGEDRSAGERIAGGILLFDLYPTRPPRLIRDPLGPLVVLERRSLGQLAGVWVWRGCCAHIMDGRGPTAWHPLRPAARERKLPQGRRGDERRADPASARSHDASLGASSTSRTLRANTAGVNGFCKKLSPGSSIP